MTAGSQGPNVEAGADVYSPDRTVRIIASVEGQVDVRVQGLRRHTEDSLALQVRAAARLALAHLQQPIRDARPGDDRSRPGWG
ncbi:hypothetical protein GCM10011608_60070 [Micromonospora sonchi]|uniref:Uncharacterized protein n=1 Tax=Micromonospora sonchi TaxID=1763543 RepID=A0A917U8U6_9ACTN|nr:hypothetical protein GCM10011608_60070 [Micromonospora sonchi]